MLHADIRREFALRLAGILAGTERLPVELRPYQVESLASLRALLANPDGPRRGHFAHATGLGKTILFAAMARVCVGLRTLIIVPTKTLVEQTTRMVSAFTGAPVGHLSSLDVIRNTEGGVVAFRGERFVDTVVTTVASFKRFAPRIAREFNPHIIIHDECHWAYVDATTRGLASFPEAVILGLSATPDYLGTVIQPGFVPVTLESGQVLYGSPNRFAAAHFGPRLDERTILWGIESGWLCPLAWGQIEFQLSLDSVPTRQTAIGPDYDDSELQWLMARHWPVMLETIRRLYASGEYDLPNRQAFAVCQSVKAAESLAETIRELGVSSACVTGKTPNRERNQILRAFRENRIRFLSSVMVLREGWDAPNAEVCMMLRPTKSRVLYQQSMGRVVRPAPDGGFKVALVLDAHFQNTRFSPLSAPVLFGAPGAKVPVGGVICGQGEGFELSAQLSPYLPREATPRIVVLDALQYEHVAGEDGMLQVDGERWGTLNALAKMLSMEYVDLHNRITPSVRRRRACNASGTLAWFYALSDVQKECDAAASRTAPAGTIKTAGSGP